MEINANAKTLGPHLKFSEQPDEPGAYPCMCWQAGYGDVTGVTREMCQHPEEFDEGAQSRYEYENDL